MQLPITKKSPLMFRDLGCLVGGVSLNLTFMSLIMKQ